MNETDDKQATRNWNDSPSKSEQTLFPYKTHPNTQRFRNDPVRHNVSYQRWDEKRIITAKTYFIEKETGSANREFLVEEKGGNQ